MKMLYEGQQVDVLEQRQRSSTVLFLNGEQKNAVDNKKLKPIKETRLQRAQRRLGELSPERISDTLISHLQRTGVDVRVFWAEAADTPVRNQLSALGITVPEDIRPIRSGAKGSNLIQYGVSAEVRFSVPEDTSVLPEGYRLENDNTVYVPRVGFALGLVVAGFPINCYTAYPV